MRSLRILSFVALSLSLFALTTPSNQALKIELNKPNSNNGLGGGAEKQDSDSSSVETLKGPEERETFKSLVIADLPRPLGFELETVAQAVTDATGIVFAPAWFRVDMAHLTSNTEFNGKEVAKKLGLQIIANFSDHLILAAKDTAAAQRAEARMFLYDLFESKDRMMWHGLLQENNNNYRAKSSSIVRIGPRIIVRSSSSQSEPGKAQPSEQDSVLKDLSEADVFAQHGALNDEKVMAALGLTAQDLDYPLSLRYPISAFKIKPKNNSYGRYYYDGGMFSMGQVWMNPFTIFDRLRVDRRQSGEITIVAHTGDSSHSTPKGPNTQLVSFNLLDSLYNPFGGFGNDYGYDYGYEEEPESQAESALFVSLTLSGFTRNDRADMSKLVAFEKSVRQSIELRDQKLLSHAQRNVLLYAKRNISPRQLAWGDHGATDLLVDPSDSSAQIRETKRLVVKKAVEVLRQWARVRNGSDPAYGSLEQSNVTSTYSIDYDAFNSNYYRSSYLEFQKPKEAALAKEAIIFTTQGRNDYGQNTDAMKFSVRINFETGDVLWLEGEPESEDALIGRRKELRSGAELLVNALRTRSEGVTPDSEWIKATFQAAKSELLWTTYSDYQVIHLLNGFYRVIADDPGKTFTQRALFSTSANRVTWETLKEPALNIYNNRDFEELW